MMLINPFGQYPADNSYASVSTLLHFNGGNAAAIVDNGPRPKTYTQIGNAATTTARALFGDSSLGMDGTGDGLSTPYDADFHLGNGEFTIEAAVWLNSAGSDSLICSLWKSGALSWIFGVDTSRRLTHYWSTNGSSGVFTGISATNAVPTGQWTQLALVRSISGGFQLLEMYVDGTRVVSQTTSTITYFDPSSAGAKFVIGGHDGNPLFPAGNIDEVRITKGVARYTGASYTPAGAQYPDA